MNDIPFELSGLSGLEIDLFLNTFRLVKDNLGADFDNDKGLSLNGFELFNHYYNHSILSTIRLSNDAHIAFIKVVYPIQNASNHPSSIHYEASENQSWAVVSLKRDFGHVIIRKETLIDKLSELIHHTEIKLGDKDFDKKFYVIADDREKALLSLNDSFRDLIMDLKGDFVIEINGKQLIIGNRKPIESQATLHLASVANAIALLK